MTIRFLKDHTVGQPAETFAHGEVVADRGDASEAHFVRRGIAAYQDAEGNLTDIDGNPVVFAEKAEVVTVSDNRTDTDDGTPDRASSGPDAAEAEAAALARPAPSAVLSASDLKKKADPK